jgi:hypothetical protein
MAKAIAVQEDLRPDIGSDGSGRQGAEAVDLEAELGADEAAQLLRAIDEADAEYERGGEVAEVEVVMQELHQILRG